MGKRVWPARLRVINESNAREIASRVDVASTIWQRGRGLMLRAGLADDCGLLIDPCSSVHSMWMRFPIDVLYVNADDVVVRAEEAMSPWRIGPIFTGARYVVELPSGTIAASQTVPGNRLRFEAATADG